MTIKKNNVTKSYILFLKNAFNFKGRTRRSDYWNVAVVNFVIQTLLMLINLIEADIIQIISVIALIVFELLTLMPMLSLNIRRLHDIGKSGYVLLLFLVPVAGQIILFLYMLKDSQQETNNYGKSTKYAEDITGNYENIRTYCPVCKSVINEEDYVCSKCGSKIVSEDMYE